MAWVEKPLQLADGSWHARVRTRAGGAGTPFEDRWANGDSRQACLEVAELVRLQMDASRQMRTRSLGATNMTVSELAATWLLDFVAVKNKPRTYRAYVGLVDRYLLPVIGARRARSLTPQDGLAWAAEVRRIAASAAPGGGGAATDKVVRVVHGMFEWSLRLQAVDHNFVANLPTATHKPPVLKRRYAPTPEHIALLRAIVLSATFERRISETRRLDSALIISLLGYEAFRQEDLEAATLGQALFPSGEVREAFEIYEGKTPAAAREPELWELVRREFDELALRRAPYAISDPLIHGERGGAFSRRNWQRDVWEEARMIAIATDLVGLPGAPKDIGQVPDFITPHMLRRGGASMMGYAGIEEMTVREHLGHDDVTVTLRFYQKPHKGGGWRRDKSMDDQIEAAERFIDSPGVRRRIEQAVLETADARRQRAQAIAAKHRAYRKASGRR